MRNNTYRLLVGLLMTTFFAACTRPVAYFQPTQRAYYSTAPAAALPVTTPEMTQDQVAVAPATESPAVAPPVAQAQAAVDQLDAVVRNDSKLKADKSVQKRISRVRTLLASAAAKTTAAPASAGTQKKSTLMERLMLKKMNRKISRQLAPSNPNKPMASTGILAAGAVLVIVALILLLTGVSSTLSIILLLAGAVVLLVGLL